MAEQCSSAASNECNRLVWGPAWVLRSHGASYEVGDVVEMGDGRFLYVASVGSKQDDGRGRVLEGVECDRNCMPRGDRLETFRSTEAAGIAAHVPEESVVRQLIWSEAEEYLRGGEADPSLFATIQDGRLRQRLYADIKRERAKVVPDPLPRWVWGVAANVVDENEHGEEHAVRHGIKYFRANQRVWCYPASWSGGWFERLYVIGRLRDRHDLICVVVAGEKLRNARVKRIYSPNVIRKAYASMDTPRIYIYDVWGQSAGDRLEAENLAEIMNERWR